MLELHTIKNIAEVPYFLLLYFGHCIGPVQLDEGFWIPCSLAAVLSAFLNFSILYFYYLRWGGKYHQVHGVSVSTKWEFSSARCWLWLWYCETSFPTELVYEKLVPRSRLLLCCEDWDCAICTYFWRQTISYIFISFTVTALMEYMVFCRWYSSLFVLSWQFLCNFLESMEKENLRGNMGRSHVLCCCFSPVLLNICYKIQDCQVVSIIFY
jgi:hypothetical protein